MIGLFGGTFDPIHFGHLRPALEVMEALSLEELRFIPAHVPPHRDTPLITAKQRSEMVAIAIDEQPGFVLDTCELERNGPSYTVDTLHDFRQRYGEDTPLVLLLGTDAFAGLPSWHRWEELLQLTHIVVMQRPADDSKSTGIPADFLHQHHTDSPTALHHSPAGSILRVPVTQLDISATDIRERLRQG
ncbi:MAG: nicotinic acid mononucleotide adenylyltransferase, partial [Thiothrix sp.]